MADADAWLRFLAATLAVWRVAHLLAFEDGLFAAIGQLRHALERRGGHWAQLTNCFNCLSLWAAAPCVFWLADHAVDRLLLWPALSAGAVLLEKASGRADYVEDPEIGS